MNEQAKNFEQILGSWLSTSQLVNMAVTWATWNDDDYAPVKWIAEEIVAHDQQSAREYFASVDEETQRFDAADALAMSGWNMNRINHKLS